MSKQLEVKMTITYRWWRVGTSRPVRKAHVEALKEFAMAQITEQMRQGFIGGQLLHKIGAAEYADGIGYTGWWQVEEEDTR